jgi:ribonucleoside-diphosphate reductase alpha chain
VSYLDRTDLAHVKPEGASFDDLGRGEDEGVSNVQELSETAASRSLEVLKQISSTGYLRKRLPQELVVLQGGQTGAVAFEGEGSIAALNRLVPEQGGYEGEACGDCGNYTLVRNGTCMKCNTCGGTSGCS